MKPHKAEPQTIKDRKWVVTCVSCCKDISHLLDYNEDLSTPKFCSIKCVDDFNMKQKLTNNVIQKPQVQSTWLCKSNDAGPYAVIAITEENQGHPSQVIYQGVNGKYWTRPLSEWNDKMTQYVPSCENIISGLEHRAKSDRLNLGLTLIPFHSIYRLGKIYLEGLRYGFENWKKGVNDKDFQQERLEHALNHLFLWKEGDRTEDHLAKVMWFCVTQMELERLEGIQPIVSPPTQETEQEFDEVETVAVYMVDGKPVKIKYPNLPDEGEFSHFQHFEIYNMNTVNKILDWQKSLNATYTKEKTQNG